MKESDRMVNERAVSLFGMGICYLIEVYRSSLCMEIVLLCNWISKMIIDTYDHKKV